MKHNISTNDTGYRKLYKNTKVFRIAAKNLFLTYPEEDKNGYKKLSKRIIYEHLKEKFQNKDIETLVVGQEISEDGYKHFHATIILNKKADIKNQDFLDIEGVHGSYEKIRSIKHAITYATKDNNYMSEGYDPILFSLQADKDIFKGFINTCTKYNCDPEELIRRAHNINEGETDEALLALYADYLKHPQRYNRFLNDRKTKYAKRLNESWVREDVATKIENWALKSIEDRWISKTLYIEGEPGTGKSAMIQQLIGEGGLTVRDLNQTKDFDSKKHKGIIFDDTSVKYLDREECISLIEPDTNKVINVKYGTIEIPPNIITVFISNKTPADIFRR